MVNLRQQTTISGSRISLAAHPGRIWLTALGVVLALQVQPSSGFEIGHASVNSKPGEPLDATVRIFPAPGESIDATCLALVDDQDHVESGHVLIKDAALSQQSGSSSIRITTSTPITQSAIAIALRAQCANGPAVVRTINLYLSPAFSSAPGATNPALPGSTFTVKPGDSIYKLARLIYPHNHAAMRNLARAIVLANPALFPDARARPLQIGERLIIPDVRNVDKIISASMRPNVQNKSLGPGQAGTAEPQTVSTAGHSGAGADSKQAGQARHTGKTPRPTPASKQTALQLSTIALRIDRLLALQEELNARLARLEINAVALQKALAHSQAMQNARPPSETRPVPSQTTSPTPARGDLINRMFMALRSHWLVIGGLVIVALSVGWMLARAFRSHRNMRQHRKRIDAMLEEARSAATPLLDTEPRLPARDNAAAIVAAQTSGEAGSEYRYAPGTKTGHGIADEASFAGGETETVNDSWHGAGAAGTGLTTESPEADEVPTWLRSEMDMAIDSTRSMFSDVDRFITLGRTEKAISLLEFQIKRNPAERNAWLKLMALYRDGGLNDNFRRTYAAFREQFGN